MIKSPSRGGRKAVECLCTDKLSCLYTSMKGCREVVHVVESNSAHFAAVRVVNTATVKVTNNGFNGQGTTKRNREERAVNRSQGQSVRALF